MQSLWRSIALLCFHVSRIAERCGLHNSHRYFLKDSSHTRDIWILTKAHSHARYKLSETGGCFPVRASPFENVYPQRRKVQTLANFCSGWKVSNKGYCLVEIEHNFKVLCFYIYKKNPAKYHPPNYILSHTHTCVNLSGVLLQFEWI